MKIFKFIMIDFQYVGVEFENIKGSYWVGSVVSQVHLLRIVIYISQVPTPKCSCH